MKKWIVVVAVTVAMIPVFSYKPAGKKEKLKWMTLTEVEEAKKQKQKPILIDLYTDWCGWCKVMDRKTYADKNVIAYLQEHFYFVKVNAETKEAISWSGRSFKFNPSYRTNEFALYLTQGNLSYPTTVILPTDGSSPVAIPGFLKPADIETILKYFGEGRYGKQRFDEYQQGFKSSW